MSFLSEIEEVSEEISAKDLESNQSGGYIKEGGVYIGTIDKAFISQTKKKGLQVDLFFTGDCMHHETLYIANRNNKEKKLVTTCQMQGKTVSLPSFKMFKQLMFVVTNEPVDLTNIDTREEEIKYNKYGKDVVVKGETIDILLGKTVQFAIRASEQYAYDKEAKEEDKTQLRVNGDGDTLYNLDMTEVYSEEGFTAIELAKSATEAKSIVKMKEFLASDKAIKKVVLELPEVEEEDDLEDIIAF